MTIDREDVLIWAVVLLSIVLRAFRLGGVDVFEDGYTNYLIVENLHSTGEYSDRIAGMTEGNWLPLYHFIGAGALSLFGTDSMLLLRCISLALSAGTVVLAGSIGRRFGTGIGAASALFMALNPLDILMASMTLPDDLALFLLTLSTYLFLFKRDSTAMTVLGSAAMLGAVMTRYEAWAAMPLLAAWNAYRGGRRGLVKALAPFAPSAFFILSWTALASDGTFLIDRVFHQTSLQPMIVRDITGLEYGELAVLFWYGYSRNYLVVIALAASVLFMRRELGGERPYLLIVWWSFWTLVTVLIAAGLMVGSYRYLAYAAFALTIIAAVQLKRISESVNAWMNRKGGHRLDPEGTLTFTMSVIVVAILLVPSIDYSFSREDSVSVLNEPQMRAGRFLHDNYEGGLVLVDSPIAAYYSEVPISEVSGSHTLPDDREGALSYIEGNVSWIVFTDHPHFKIASLFPEMRNGSSWGPFVMRYTPNSWEVDFGALPTFVYEVAPETRSHRVDEGFSVRFDGREKAITVPLLDEKDIAGSGRGIGAPALVHGNVTYLPGRVDIAFLEDGARMVYRMGSGAGTIGTVVVEYTIVDGLLQVLVDYQWVPVSSRLVMLNEFSAGALGRFVDFAGNDTFEPGPWVETRAWYNYLLDGDGRGVMLEYVDGATMYVGNLERDPASGVVGLNYVIEVGENGPYSFEYVIHPVRPSS